MADKVGVMVVGVGFVGGQAHTPSFKKIEGSELVALCARTENRVKALAEKYEVKYYLDYDKALQDPKIDAVVLSVPTPLHYPYAMKAIKKKKHVLCEMPVAANLDQIDELSQAAKDAGVLIMPILNFRFAPIYLKVKEMIGEGAIGKPIALHYREFLPAAAIAEQWPGGGWAWNVKESGGYPDFTLSVWSIDMIRWMFRDEFKRAQWMSSYPKFEDYKGILGYNTMGIAKFKSGMVGSFHFGASVNESASTTRLEVYGDNTNVIHAIWNDKVILYRKGAEPEEIKLDVKGARVWGHRQLDEHFVECVLKNKRPKVTLKDAFKAQRVATSIAKNIPAMSK